MSEVTADTWNDLTDEEARSLGDHCVRNLRSLKSEDGSWAILALLASKGSTKAAVLRTQFDALMLSYENYRREQAFNITPHLAPDLLAAFADQPHPVDLYFQDADRQAAPLATPEATQPSHIQSDLINFLGV